MGAPAPDYGPGDLVRAGFTLYRVVRLDRRRGIDGAVLRPANEARNYRIGDGILPSWCPDNLIEKVTPEMVCQRGLAKCKGCGKLHLETQETQGLTSIEDPGERVPRKPGYFYGELVW